MKKYFIILTNIFLFGCHSTKSLLRDDVIGQWKVSYVIFDANPMLHKSYTIHAKATNGTQQTLYWFFEDKDAVHKSEAKRMKAETDYRLIFDTTFNYRLDKEEVLAMENSIKISGKLINLSSLDSAIFQKIVLLSSSNNLKDFNYLTKAKYFKVIAKRLKTN